MLALHLLVERIDVLHALATLLCIVMICRLVIHIFGNNYICSNLPKKEWRGDRRSLMKTIMFSSSL